MLILDSRDDVFRDSHRRSMRYRVPAALAPLLDDNGIPRVLLAVYHGGAVLDLQLGAEWPALGPDEQRVAPAAVRYRTSSLTSDRQRSGEWYEAIAGPERILACSIALDATEAALTQRLIRTGADGVLQIDVELMLRGVTPAYPWRVSVDGALLHALLLSRLGDAEVERSAIERAFLGLQRDAQTWFPLHADALPAPADEAMALMAHHAIPLLFEQRDGGLHLGPPPAGTVDIDLSQPRQRQRWRRYSWSLDAFLRTQAHPDAFVRDIAVADPFEAADLLLTHDLPLSDDGIRKLHVQIHTGGPDADLHHAFRVGDATTTVLRFIRPTFRNTPMEASIRATVLTSAGPRVLVVQTPVNGMTLHIDAAVLRVVAVAVLADEAVFDHVASVELTVGSRRITLQRDAPLRWAIRSTPPSPASVAVVLGSGERVTIGAIPPVHDRIVVTVEHLGAHTRTPLSFIRPASVAASTAYLAVAVDAGPWQSVDDSRLEYGHVARVNTLLPMSHRYRLRYVPKATDGSTAPMVETPWRTGIGDDLEIGL